VQLKTNVKMSKKMQTPRQTSKQKAKIFLRKSGGCESAGGLKMSLAQW
jgi:hypothetical protein